MIHSGMPSTARPILVRFDEQIFERDRPLRADQGQHSESVSPFSRPAEKVTTAERTESSVDPGAVKTSSATDHFDVGHVSSRLSLVNVAAGEDQPPVVRGYRLADGANDE